MAERELDKLCELNPQCDCKCAKCALFARWYKTHLNEETTW